MKRRKMEKLTILVLILMIVMPIVSLSLKNASASDLPAEISVSVKDAVTGASVADANVYVIKNPFSNATLSLVSNMKVSSNQEAVYSLNSGTYSIGAYHPDLGYAVKVINVTSDEAAKTIPIVLELKPVAENWTDLNGITYRKLISWPFISSASARDSSSGDSAMDDWPILLDEQTFEQYDTKVGEVYSSQGLTVNLRLKFASSIETKWSLWGGPLQVGGSTQESSTSVVSLGPVSNSESRTVNKKYDYTYQLWYYGWDYFEVWSETQIYPSSAVLSAPYPTPSYKPLDQIDDILDATDKQPYETKESIITYNDLQGGSWSVGASVVLSGAWNYYSGSVGLGGTFSFSSHTQYETVYTLTLQGGRIVYIYGWNNPGQQQYSGTVLTYQNWYWAAEYIGYGCISGGGQAHWPENLIGHTHDGNYAQIYASNDGDAAYIAVELSVETTGHIYVYGYSANGYFNSHLYTYVSDDGQNWDYALMATLCYQDGLHYIDCGWFYDYNFKYVAFAGYDDNGFSVCLMLDAVHVVK